jgi:hypothetical protein
MTNAEQPQDITERLTNMRIWEYLLQKSGKEMRSPIINLEKLKGINLHNTHATPLRRASQTSQSQYFLQHYSRGKRSSLAAEGFQINVPPAILVCRSVGG